MANLSTAWNEGYNARMSGISPIGANPYLDHLSDEHDHFWYGWNAALDVLCSNEPDDGRVEELTVRGAIYWMLDGIQIRIHALSQIGKEPMSFDDIPF